MNTDVMLQTVFECAEDSARYIDDVSDIHLFVSGTQPTADKPEGSRWFAKLVYCECSLIELARKRQRVGVLPITTRTPNTTEMKFRTDGSAIKRKSPRDDDFVSRTDISERCVGNAFDIPTIGLYIPVFATVDGTGCVGYTFVLDS